MKYSDMVAFCVSKLIDEPDALEVIEARDGDAVQVQIRVAPDDTGKVIGRSGRLVSCLRHVVGYAAAKKKKTVYVKVLTES